MPMSPQQILTDKQKKRAKLISDQCVLIDEYILEKFNGDATPLYYWNNELKDKFVREEVIKVYEKVGWAVEYQSDQKDGNSLVFTPRKNKNGYFI